MLSADLRSAFHGIFASGHRRPTGLFDQTASLVVSGFLQRGKLRDGVRATFEAADAVGRRELRARAFGSV